MKKINLVKPLLLGSGSPRRREILEMAGFEPRVLVKNVDESFDQTLAVAQVPLELAKKKLSKFEQESASHFVLCADTIVVLGSEILNKPESPEEAFEMLSSLSGQTHFVYTGVAMQIGTEVLEFVDEARVSFSQLQKDEISFYIQHYQPFDKAGSYGIQDFLGMNCIHRLEGSFYTVMGLPIHLVYQKLRPFMRLD